MASFLRGLFNRVQGRRVVGEFKGLVFAEQDGAAMNNSSTCCVLACGCVNVSRRSFSDLSPRLASHTGLPMQMGTWRFWEGAPVA